MERTLNENLAVEGDKFQCSCGNTEFHQECFSKSIEKVGIIRRRDKSILIVSYDMIPPNDDEIEYNNSFICPQCGKEYFVSSSNGTDIIVDDEE